MLYSRIIARSAALLLVILTGCAVRDRKVSEVDEQSVRPGINDPYFNADAAQWVERFEREGREVYDQRHLLIDECGLSPGMAVADVGAGTGLFTALLAERVGPDGMVYAVDIVPDFIESIEQRLVREQGLGNVRPVLCTERSVELPDESVDLVFICDTYHHFEYPQSTMASIRRALRPGGIVVLIDFERIPGVSSDWILDHVRAGKLTVLNEVVSAGFEIVREQPLYADLKDNYVLVFRKPRSDR